MKVVKRNHDIAGLEITRIAWRNLIVKLIPLWPLREYPGAGPLATLLTRHYLGYPIAFVTEKYQHHWIILLNLWRRTRYRLGLLKRKVNER